MNSIDADWGGMPGLPDMAQAITGATTGAATGAATGESELMAPRVPNTIPLASPETWSTGETVTDAGATNAWTTDGNPLEAGTPVADVAATYPSAWPERHAANGAVGLLGTSGILDTLDASGASEQAETPGHSDVDTLRAILWRGQSAEVASPSEVRLRAIEQRLDALATRQVAGSGAPAAASPDGEQWLASVERQIADLRQDHDQLAANATAFANELDLACRLRQRRVRVANRLELQRLRRQVYARPGAFGAAPAVAVAPGQAVVSDGARATDAPYWPLPQHVETVHTSGLADRVVLRTYTPADPFDAAGAWYAVRHAAVALVMALWALLAVLGRLIAEDARGLWEWMRDEWHGRGH